MSFKQLRVALGLGLFLFLQQLHLLRSLPDQTSMLAAGLDQEKLVRETTVSQELSSWIKLGHKLEMKAVAKHSANAVGTRGGGGIPSNGGGENSGGGQGTAVIPVYAAGANHNRYHHNHGSNCGHINCARSICLLLTLFTSFFFVLHI